MPESQLSAFSRLKLHKEVIKEAAQMARNDLLVSNATSNFSVAQSLTTVARMVARNDSGMASRMAAAFADISHVFYVDTDTTGGPRVRLTDPEKFEKDIAAAKLSRYEEYSDQLEQLQRAFGTVAPDMLRKKGLNCQLGQALVTLWQAAGLIWSPGRP